MVIPYFLGNLLHDINDNTKNIDEVIIVVSGDIAYKSGYAAQKNAIIYFFGELKSILRNKIKGIVFVPGNHDITRGSYDSNYKIMNKADSGSGVLSGYDEYMALINEIRGEYGFGEEELSFGIEEIKCSGSNCCFIKADTAWCTAKGDISQGDIILGEYQKKFLLNKYRATAFTFFSKNSEK